MPFSKLPREVSADLKWLAWNDIWAAVNARLATAGGGSDGLRQKRQRQGEEDLRRSAEHVARIGKAEAIQAETLERFQEQVKVVANASAEAALEGKWLPAAKAQQLEAPNELEQRLWGELVKGIKSAGVAVILLSHDELQKAEQLRLDFEDVWAMHSESPNLGE